MTAMSGMAEATTGVATEMPRFADGSINLQEVLRQLAESVVNEVMGAEADQPCEATGDSGNGYRERMPATCAGTLTLRAPKLRSGSFFPEDVLERYQRVDRAVAAAVAETCATGTSTRKVQRVAAAMGIERMSRDQAGAICAGPGSGVGELSAGPLGDLPTPYLRLDATYVKRRRSGRVASTAVVAAIGCDSEGWRRVPGAGVVDTEGHDSWSAFLGRVRERGVGLVTPDAHEGLRRAVEETFRGAAWQRRAARLTRDRARAASGCRRTSRRVPGIAAPAFRLREAGAVRAAYHLAVEMLGGRRPEGARMLEEAEPDAPACLDFPPSHWKRLRANNLQERTNREIKRRSRVAQVFPSEASPERLAGAVMCGQDEEWSRSGHFSGRVMPELPDEPGARQAAAPTGEQLAAFRLVARRAIEASLELADELEAAWHRRMIEGSGRWSDRRTSRYTNFSDTTGRRTCRAPACRRAGG